MNGKALLPALIFFLGACSTPGMAEQSSAHDETEGSYFLNIESLDSFQQMIGTGFPVADRSWTSTLACGQKSVYLTFDDGPKPYATENVLDILDSKKVKGTFFLIGRKAEKHPDIVREIVNRGHTVGNHTYSHIMPWGENYKRYLADAIKGKKLLEEITGREVRLMRPPGGNLRLINEIEKKGMKVVLWTTLSGDCAAGKPPAYLLSLIKMQEEFRPLFHYPMIILMHDTSTRTAKALPKIIDFLKKKGYRFRADWS